MLKLTMQQIMYFLDLCNTLNFTETAKKHYLSQPALSRQINILEEKVGTQLFVRNHRSVSLTPEGELLKEEFLSFIQQYEHMMESVAQIANHKTGILKIAFSDYLNMGDLCQNYIYPFSEKYPLIQLHCESLTFTKLKQLIIEHGADIFLLPGYELDVFSSYESAVISTEPVGIIVPKTNPLYFEEELNPELLNGKPLLLLDNNESSSFSRRAFSICKKAGITPGETIFIPTISSLFASLQCGLGFTISNVTIAEKNPDLLRAFGMNLFYPERIYALWNSNNSNFALKKFKKSMIEKSDYSDN